MGNPILDDYEKRGRFDGASETWGGFGNDHSYEYNAQQRWKGLQGAVKQTELSGFDKQYLANAEKQADESRQQQMQMYGLAQNWANGGVTPQQQQMQQGFETQRIGTNAVANAAIGGARGSIAARQNAGMQTAQDAQFNDLSMQQQKAKDQQLGQQMMMQAANQMRQGDQRSIDLATDYARANEQNRLGWQHMNDQNDMFYGNLSDNQRLAMMGVNLDEAEVNQRQQQMMDAQNDQNRNAAIGAAAGGLSYAAKSYGE